MDFTSLPRFIVFIITIATLLALEHLYARKARNNDAKRLGLNIGLGVVGVIILKVLAPLSLIHAGLLTQDREFGLINWLSLSPLSIPIGLVLFDLLIYWQHRLFHEVDFLWQFHRLHHKDDFLDLSSGLRFHPIEFLISYSLKLIFILCFGLGPWSVLFCEIWLNSMSLFTHANIAIPNRLDNFLKRYIVTPNYHYIHHSTKSDEMNSNYCNGISLWDSLFSTYSPSDQDKISKIRIGLIDN